MSDIEWTDETWNPVTGCTRASRGCDSCYAVGMTRRLGAQGHPKYVGLVNPGKSHFNGTVRTHEDELGKPFTWKKPRTVFVNSMSDLFHKDVPFSFIDRVFAVMGLTPQHTYQVLTKRPERMALYTISRGYTHPSWREAACGIRRPGATQEEWLDGIRNLPSWPLPNVWMGTSVEDQAAADERIPHVLRVPAAVRFLSCEPLLGPLDLSKCLLAHHLEGHCATRGVHWVIVGGESGPGARACDIAWIRSVVEQCRSAGVRTFVKQLGKRPVGEWGPNPPTCELTVAGVPGTSVVLNRHKNGVWRLSDAKGGWMNEWPQDLRVRQMPA